MITILFVCIANSCRSQIAEACAHLRATDKILAYSAGSHPSGHINANAVHYMDSLGYDLSKHTSKSVDEFRGMEIDYLVTMGCADHCPFIRANHRLDRNIPTPSHMSHPEFAQKIGDPIAQKVKELLQHITANK